MRFLPPASMLPTLFVAPAWAAEFQAVPTLYLSQTYTDNATLAPAGQERGDWVTTVRPGIALVYSGANLQYTASYNAEFLLHSLNNDTALNNQFNGSGSYQILPQFLFVDSSSSISQANVSAFGAQPVNNINTTNNRTTIRTFLVSPHARYSFGGEANTEVRYTYSVVDSAEAIGQAVNSGSNRFDASLASGAAYKATSWRLAYYWEKIDYDYSDANTLARETTLESITASVQHLITPTLAAVGNLGYEDNNYPATEASSPSGTNWSLGFNWTPTPRTKLYATAGHRFYGKSYALDFSHRTRLTVWSANYSEDVTTTRQQILAPTLADTATYLDTLLLTRIPDPVARQKAVQDEIARQGLPNTLLVPVNIYTDQVYIQKAFRAFAGIQSVFHTVLANVYSLRRTPQTPALAIAVGGLESGSELRQNGVGLTWSWRITPYTTSNLSLGYNRSETPLTGREDNNQYARVGLSHVIGPKTTGAISYQRLHTDSNVSAGYKENQVAATVQMRF